MFILALAEETLSVKVQFEIFLESESDLKYFGQQHFTEGKGSILLYSIVFCCIGAYFVCSMALFSITGSCMTLQCCDGFYYSIVYYFIVLRSIV